MIDSARVPGTSIFVLGLFERRLTVFSQQVRALNLVDAIIAHKLVRDEGNVAIVGGGAAGATAAVAFARALPKLKSLDLYEQRGGLLELQRNSGRYLHPHIYDWPASGSGRMLAGLPVMDWSADDAGAVSDQLRRQFEDARTRSNLTVFLRTPVASLHPRIGGAGLQTSDGPAKDYDLVILAIGFGVEAFLGPTDSYWSHTALAGPIIRGPRARPLLFISGNGDGGLVDFTMAAFDGMSHQAICKFIIELPLGSALEELMDVEREAWAPGADIDLLESYRARVMPLVPDAAWSAVRERLREDVAILYHTREPRLLRKTTAVINRLAAALILEVDRHWRKDRIEIRSGIDFVDNKVPAEGPVELAGMLPFTPDRRILRLGTDQRSNLAPFDGVLASYVARHGSQAPLRPFSPQLTASAAIRFSRTRAMRQTGSRARARGRPGILTSETETLLLAILAARREVGREDLYGCGIGASSSISRELDALHRAKYLDLKDGSYSVSADIQSDLDAQLSARIEEEIRSARLDLLCRLPLIDTTQAQDVIDRQIDMNLRELRDNLTRKAIHSDQILSWIMSALEAVRSREVTEQAVAAGNLLNILGMCRAEGLSDLEFSGLVIRNGYFRDVMMRQTVLEKCSFEACIFSDTFGSIWMVGFMPDGSELLASSVSGEVRAWDIVSGAPAGSYGRHNGWSFVFAVRADGEEIASGGGDGCILVWTHGKPDAPEPLIGHHSRVRGLVFHPDGWLASVSEDRTLRRWTRDWARDYECELVHTHDLALCALALHPGGGFAIIGAADGSLLLWDIRSNSVRKCAQAHDSQVRALSFSADGRWLVTAAEEHAVSIWSTATWTKLASIPHATVTRAASFDDADPGLLATGDDDGTLRSFELLAETPKPGAKAPRRLLVCERQAIAGAHTSLIRSVSLRGSGALLASGADDQTVRLWRADGAGQLNSQRIYPGHLAQARSLAIDSRGIIAVGHDDGVIRRWRQGQDRPLPDRPRNLNSRIWSLAFAEDGKFLLAGTEDGSVWALSRNSSVPRWRVQDHRYRVFSLSLRPATADRPALLASGGSDRIVRLRRVEDGHFICSLPPLAGRIRDVAFDPTGNLLAVASEDGTISLWREDGQGWARAGEDLLIGEPGCAVRFHPDPGSRLLFSGGELGTVIAWDYERCIRARPQQMAKSGPMLSLAISSSGKEFATGHQDGTVIVWQVSSLEQSQPVLVHSNWVEKVAYSPDGRFIATVSDDESMSIIDMSDLKVIQNLREPRRYEGLSLKEAKYLTADQLVRLRALGAEIS